MIWNISAGLLFGFFCFLIGLGLNRDEREEKVMPEYEKEIEQLKQRVESLKGTLSRVVTPKSVEFLEIKMMLEELEEK